MLKYNYAAMSFLKKQTQFQRLAEIASRAKGIRKSQTEPRTAGDSYPNLKKQTQFGRGLI